MADPFTRKFVDLVRNTVTTVGTGNFTLGPAVNGYSGIAQALQVGALRAARRGTRGGPVAAI